MDTDKKRREDDEPETLGALFDDRVGDTNEAVCWAQGTNESSRRGCIFLRPQFDSPDAERISEYRAHFDPLAGKVSPHVTLVFPFPLMRQRLRDVRETMLSLTFGNAALRHTFGL